MDYLPNVRLVKKPGLDYYYFGKIPVNQMSFSLGIKWLSKVGKIRRENVPKVNVHHLKALIQKF